MDEKKTSTHEEYQITRKDNWYFMVSAGDDIGKDDEKISFRLSGWADGNKNVSSEIGYDI